jgi:RHS repeat-associated protein
MIIRIEYPEAEVWLDLWGGTSGTFAGLDQFNRIIDQRWQNSTSSTPTDIDRYQYGYDQDSNRIWKANVVGTPIVTGGLDEYYAYDNLNRLVVMQRGTLNGNQTAIGGALIARQLGRWVASGNTQSHTVKLVDASTGTDLPGGSVSVNTSGATAGQYLYASLATPLPLAADSSYFLMSAEVYGTDQWYQDNSTVTSTSDLTVTNSEWYDGTYHVNEVGNNSYVPPNMIYGLNQPAITAQSLTYLRYDFTGGVGFAFTTATGTPVRQMQWTLDATGNWSQYLTQTSGSTDLAQTRTSNTVNEITALTESTGPTWVTPAYDAAGNTTTMPQVSDPTQSFTATYDAWNRMTGISASGTTVAKYQYDGRNRRAVKQTYTGGSLSETRHFYFTNSWQDVEERVGTSTAMDKQYVWGTRYVDELVCRDDATPQRLYACQDANFNVTSITDTSGAVQERFVYDPYGMTSILNAIWAGTSDVFNWLCLFQGSWLDATIGFYVFRHRNYSPNLGRWYSRDFANYTDGINLYQMETGYPLGRLDPLGLDGISYPFGVGPTSFPPSSVPATDNQLSDKAITLASEQFVKLIQSKIQSQVQSAPTDDIRRQIQESLDKLSSSGATTLQGEIKSSAIYPVIVNATDPLQSLLNTMRSQSGNSGAGGGGSGNSNNPLGLGAYFSACKVNVQASHDYKISALLPVNPGLTNRGTLFVGPTVSYDPKTGKTSPGASANFDLAKALNLPEGVSLTISANYSGNSNNNSAPQNIGQFNLSYRH